MAKNVKFVLHRKNFQNQILYGRGVDTEGLLRSVAGEDAVIEASSNAKGGGRLRARVYGDMSDEAQNGTLSRRLSGAG